MPQKTRSPWRYFLIFVALLSLLWLAGVLYLDFSNGMFPRVLIGGLKILVAGYLLLLVFILPVLALRKLARRAG